MLSTKSSNKTANAHRNHHRGTKGGAAGAPPSEAKSRASRDDVMIKDVTNGVVNITLEEPKFLGRMGQESYKKKTLEDEYNQKNKTNGNDDNSSKTSASGGGKGADYKKKNGYQGHKKARPNEKPHGWKKHQQQHGSVEKGGFSSRQKGPERQIGDATSNEIGRYEWLNRINQNQFGIQGVIYLNEYGQPVTEFLPQGGYEYKIVMKADYNDQNCKEKHHSIALQDRPPRQGPSQQPMQPQPSNQGNFVSPVLPGYPILEGMVVPSGGPGAFMGNYAVPPGYSSYMYGPLPPQQGYPMMIMPPYEPLSPPHYGAPNGSMYQCYLHYPNEQQYYERSPAGFGDRPDAQGPNYNQAPRLPQMPRLDDFGMVEDNAGNDDPLHSSLEPRPVHGERNNNGIPSDIPSVLPIP